MKTAEQIHPKTGKTIRQVKIINDLGDTVIVEALYGPLAGERYDVTPEQLRR